MSFEKARDACIKKNCAAIAKRKSKIDKKTQKLKKKRCAKYDTETASMEDFFNCAKKVEEETGYTQWFKDTVKCNKKYCAKEQEDFLNALSAKLKSKKGGSKNTTQKLHDKFMACRKKECKAAYALKEKAEKIHEKNKKEQCKKDDYDCADKLYANSDYKKAYINLNACTEKVCQNEKKAYNEAFNKDYDAQFSKSEQAKRVSNALDLIKKAREKLEKK